ncbi:MAG TPA: restriction system-associated AAA family ATPase [Bacteroidia bacterium]|nr:restriction system-associated AAA family ATPase [Chitinophagales bacterium]HNL05155.1 restriction system-associated AAA family ATPase [Bacteroidia bacterium]
MKLLRLKIENEDGFRSLQKGFEINFHTLADTEAMEQFRPFCFAGLNGSGKSNVLEALANIFYHLEVCVARYLPESIKDPNNFKRNECTPDAFTLEYLIGQHDRKAYALYFFDKVIISKEEGQEPKMFIQSFPFDKSTEKREVSLVPPKARDSAAEGKVYLPAHIIGYSSGENEILSLPFIKSRLIHLDEYRQAARDNYSSFEESENSLIYIDNNMSQAVLLCCLLFENDETLAPLRNIDNTGILGLRSFRMNIHLHNFEFLDEKKSIPILWLIEQNQLANLKKCSTSWHLDQKTQTLWLDFFVNEATKAAFKEHFRSGLECFHFFRLLYELNNHFVDELTKEDVYRSKGVYTDGKLPIGNPRQDVFHFLDFYITKKIKGTGLEKDLLLRSFSDGEHQFIHTMGICLLLKDRRSLLLLDEPETHFNPSWRAKFIKILNDSITAGNPKDLPNGNFNVHLLKDVLLTSHSPFIISDCLPDNVVLFEKDGKGDTTAKKVSELDNAFNTYGTSVELILDRLFNYDQSIGDLSYSELEEIDFSSINTKEEIEKVKTKLRTLGESIEKDMVLARLNRIKTEN